MFCFSVVKHSFCFANVNFIAVPATSFVDNLRQLRTVKYVVVKKTKTKEKQNKKKRKEKKNCHQKTKTYRCSTMLYQLSSEARPNR